MHLESKEDFRLVFELSTKQKWLAHRVQELTHLLFSECDTDQKRKLVIELLGRFTHVTNSKYSELIENLVDNIIGIQGLTDESCQVVAMAADSSSDSSQRVLYDLKLLFEQRGWRKYRHVNQFSAAYRTHKQSPKHNNIVLIDEFIGSGQSAIGRVDGIKRQFNIAGITDLKIYIRTLAGMKEGVQRVRDSGIDVEALILLDKGITDLSPAWQVPEQIEIMRELEKQLLPTYNETDLPSLGYGQMESLYTRDGGNTPNNVFPIFWWPFKLDASERQVLLYRAMGDA